MRWGILIAGAAIAISAHALGVYIAAPVDSLRGVVTYTPPHKSYTRQAGLGLPNTPLEGFSSLIQNGVFITEDGDFNEHNGVNPRRIYSSLRRYITGKHRLCCVSTLTQQLIKNIFTGPERSFHRKYVEAIFAIKMERHFTKDEILLLYLNMAEMGNGWYGFKEGAQGYFGVEPDHLTESQAAYLVLRLPAPWREPRRNRIRWLVSQLGG